jgi:hypothetical protein
MKRLVHRWYFWLPACLVLGLAVVAGIWAALNRDSGGTAVPAEQPVASGPPRLEIASHAELRGLQADVKSLRWEGGKLAAVYRFGLSSPDVLRLWKGYVGVLVRFLDAEHKQTGSQQVVHIPLDENLGTGGPAGRETQEAVLRLNPPPDARYVTFELANGPVTRPVPIPARDPA